MKCLSVIFPRVLAFIAISMGLCVESVASSDVGMDVSVGDFQIKVTRSDTEEVSQDITYLTEPRGLLYDVISIAQRNYKTLSRQKERYWIDVSFELSTVYVFREGISGKKYEPISSVRFSGDFEPTLRGVICDVLRIRKCFSGLGNATYIYVSRSALPLDHPDIILFGAFPSDQLESIFVLKRSERFRGDFRRTRITRESIQKLFQNAE